jgi:rhomboid protease GluP
MTEGPEQSPSIPTVASPSRPTWITPLAGIICIGVFVGLLMQGDYESEEALARFGLLSAERIWDGAYRGLFTPAFIHFEIWHIALNLYWLWQLGSMMERRIGYLPYLAFYLVAAFVASSAQLAGSGTTGIGASGVVYAIFGFMWVCRRHFPEFAGLLDDRIIKGFLVWAVACVVLTRLNLFQVANAAHFGGLIFGMAVGGCVVMLRGRRVGMIAAVAGLIVASVVALFWSPWSVTWLSHRAYRTHMEGNYQAALGYYTRVLKLDDANAWAYQNRSLAQLELGNRIEAEADFRKAKALDPTIKDGE